MAETVKLTDRLIAEKSQPDTSAQIFIWDSVQSGFGVRITTGSKSFVFQSRTNGKTRRVTIGRFPDWTTETARKQARKLAVDMDTGTDPNQVKRQHKVKGITLKEALEQYLANNTGLKERTRKDYQDFIHRCIPEWLSVGLFDITPQMVEKKHTQLASTSPSQANLLMRYFRAIYRSHAGIAEMNGLTVPPPPTNILSVKKQWKRIERKTSIVPSDRMKDYWSTLTTLEQEGKAAATVFKVLLLTGLRINEAQKLAWADIDFTQRSLTIKDTKNRKDHTLPMGDYLFNLISKLPRHGDQVLMTERGAITNLRYVQQAVLKQTGLWISPHDLRRTFASIAAELLPAYLLKRLTNHANGADVTLGYVVKSVADLREPMQKVENAILSLAGQTITPIKPQLTLVQQVA
jgi:integrase